MLEIKADKVKSRLPQALRAPLSLLRRRSTMGLGSVLKGGTPSASEPLEQTSCLSSRRRPDAVRQELRLPPSKTITELLSQNSSPRPNKDLLQLVLVKAAEVASSLPHAVRATLPLLRRNEGKIFRLMMVLDMVNEGTAASAPAVPLALSQLLYSRRQHGAARPSLLLPVKILAECRRRRGLNPLHKAKSTTMEYPIQKPSRPNLGLRRLLQTKAAKVALPILRLLMVLTTLDSPFQ
jgi:hypothetical protein